MGSGNSRVRSVNYTPRMTDLDAFDMCHHTVKHALETALISWDAYAALRYQRKHGAAATVNWINCGDAVELQRPWGRGFPCPTHALGLKPLKPTYAEPA